MQKDRSQHIQKHAKSPRPRGLRRKNSRFSSKKLAVFFEINLQTDGKNDQDSDKFHPTLTQCSPHLRAVLMQCSRNFHPVFTQFSYSFHASFAQFSRSFHAVFTQFSRSFHAVFTQFSPHTVCAVLSVLLPLPIGVPIHTHT